MLFAVMTTSIAEFSTYLMIYRKAEYKDLKKDIKSANEKIKRLEEQFHSSSGSQKAAKKKKTLENSLKGYNQKMTFFRMKSTFLIGVFMIIVLSSLGNAFQGTL